MRNKILATLLVGAVAAAGVIGFTACNNGNGDKGSNGGEEIQKGEQVTEAQWKEAISSTQTAENYTVTLDFVMKAVGVKTDDKTVTYTLTQSQNAKFYFDLTNKKLNMDSTSTTKSTGGAAVGEEDVDYSVNSYIYNVIEDTTVWECNYPSMKGDKWEARPYKCETESAAKEMLAEDGFASLFEGTFSTTKGGEEATLSNLYSAFKYENGSYTATLYSLSFGDDSVELTLLLKSGHVISFQYKTVSVSADDGFDITTTSTAAYDFSNFGSTTVNAPAEAVQAIADAKAQAANPSVAGKTFVFESLNFAYDSSVSEEMKQQMESLKPQMEAEYEGSEMIFGNNRDFTMTMNVQGQNMDVVGTYTQDGNSVVLTPVTMGGEPAPADTQSQTFTSLEGKLSMSDVSAGITITMVYALQNA